MEENQIDQVIANLSKIETSASKVQEEAEKEKAEYTQLIESKIKEFDEELNSKTNTELTELSDNLARTQQRELDSMRAAILEDVAHIEEAYNEKHTQWAQEIFEQIIKE